MSRHFHYAQLSIYQGIHITLVINKNSIVPKKAVKPPYNIMLLEQYNSFHAHDVLDRIVRKTKTNNIHFRHILEDEFVVKELSKIRVEEFKKIVQSSYSTCLKQIKARMEPSVLPF